MSARLKVLFVIGTMSGGGAERQVIEILKHLDRARFEPLLYLATRAGELLDQVPADVPIHSFRDGATESTGDALARKLKLSPLLRYLHLAKVLRRERIDVIYDRTYRATLDAAGATWFRPTPRVSCCVIDPQPELELHAGRSRIVWRLARSAYRRASLVLANSEALRQRVIDYFQLPADRVARCQNLLSLDELDRRAAEPASGYPAVSENVFTIVTAGRLHPQKGFSYLLEAIRDLVYDRHRSLHLSILGTGEQEAELRDQIRSCGLESNVTLAGFVPNPVAWFRQSRLFVLPSLYEGFPNALLEAVACGTPALSTDCHCGPAEILDHGRRGTLVPPANAKALADAIESVMDTYPDCQLRAMAARDDVRSRYDASSGIRELEDDLQRVVSARR
jgi:glycosyltransferase involved in cell wall biosynthesis